MAPAANAAARLLGAAMLLLLLVAAGRRAAGETRIPRAGRGRAGAREDSP